MPKTFPKTKVAPKASEHTLFRVGCDDIPPDITQAERFRYFSFPAEDRELILRCRGTSNRLGFALLLGGVRLISRFPRSLSRVSQNLLDHLCKQLKLEPADSLQYPGREATRIEHMEQIRRHLGLRRFSAEDREVVQECVRIGVANGARLHDLLQSVETALRQQDVLLPSCALLNRLIGNARAPLEDEIFKQICARVPSFILKRVLESLAIRQTDGDHFTLLQKLKQPPGTPSPQSFNQEVRNFRTVRELVGSSFDLSDYSPGVIERLADITNRSSTQALLQYDETKRAALILCWLWKARTEMVDTALTIGNDLIGGVFRRARNSYERAQKKKQKQIHSVLRVCGDVIKLLLDDSIPNEKLRPEIFAKFSRKRIDGLSAECRELARPSDVVYLKELSKSYSYVRRFAPQMLDAFALSATPGSEHILTAIEYLRKRDQEKVRHLDGEAPLDFVPRSWRRHINPAPGVVDRHYYEMCLLDQLRLALKSGRVHVPHSERFQALDSYLLSPEKWAHCRDELANDCMVPDDFNSYWKRLEIRLKSELRQLDQSYPQNSKLSITDDRFHVKRLERGLEPESARTLKRLIRKRLPRRQMADLLLEVNAWTGFLKAFTHISSGRPITEADTEEQVKLLTCLIAEGCNIGLADMAVIGPVGSVNQLEETYSAYVREETLSVAAAALVNFHRSQPLTEAWGQGMTSSSDAQVYGVPVRALNATFHPKYFASAGRGVAVYTHVSDTWIPFYTQVITCHARQAPYILDGLLYHGTTLEPKEHYTDTHGYTELIFAICDLLGIRFAPRIKDLPEQRLWELTAAEPYEHIGPVFSGKIKPAVIQSQWDEIMRLIATIKSGEVRASFIVERLAASGPQHSLFRALQEMGRLVKTSI